MKRVKKTIRTLAAMALICMMLVMSVSAAEPDSVWLNVTESSSTETTTAVIVADTTVTDGLVELSYDAELLTYESIQVTEAYVAMYAVNAETPGVVKISWVAPNAYELEDAVVLIQVNFSGLSEDVTLTGEMNSADGTPVTQSANLDKSGLEDAIAEAESLYKDDYTYRSWKTLETGLEYAKEVLADPTATQGEIDAAEETMRNAIASLEQKLITNKSKLSALILKAEALNGNKYTEESFQALEDALEEAKAVMADPDATQQQVDIAAQNLRDAINGLEKKTEQKPEETQAPTETEAPEETEAPDDGDSKPGSSFSDLLKKFLKGFFGWFKRP